MSAVLAVVVFATMLAGCSRKDAKTSERKPQAPPPAPVVVASVVQKPLPVQVTAIGGVLPLTSVTVRARVGGVLEKVHFKEGEDVKEGQLLFSLDRQPLEAMLRQTQATLARDAAQLENARKDASRYEQLLKGGLVAEQQYDQLRTTASALESTVRADRAVVQNAQLQVDYASIRAPMSGRTGALLVHEGDLVQANATTLVLINKLRPIDVSFALPQQQLPDVLKYRSEGTLAVQAVDPARNQEIARGVLSFVDNRVDASTGTIQLKATFENAENRLWPGQFVNVVLTLTTEPNAIVIPAQAIQTGQAGRFVFVVKPDRTAEVRPVTIERQAGAESVVSQGLRPGESVVLDGQMRLAAGARVEVKNTATAAAPSATGSPSASPATDAPAASPRTDAPAASPRRELPFAAPGGPAPISRAPAR